MKKAFLLLAILLVVACKKSEEPIEMNKPPTIPDVPSCVLDIINDPALSEHLQTVRVQELNNEMHYWLNTDFVEVDGSEFIVNSDCDTLCFFCGFCVPPECADDYSQDEWTTIWEE